MAEERRGKASDRLEESPAEAALSVFSPVAKNKKKLGKTGILFIVLLMAFGVGTGLHFSGLWDARPLVWGVIPQIPYVGKDMADFFGIPEQYTLTVAERRAYEQNERQKRLDERERGLIDRELAVDAASAEIALRSQRLADLEALAMDNEARRADDVTSEAEQELIAQRIRDFKNMTPRSAAQIVEEMKEELAVKILQGLGNDTRASILGRMDVRKAARLVELMSIQ